LVVTVQIDEVLADSFPASDPPSWTLGYVSPSMREEQHTVGSDAIAREAADGGSRMEVMGDMGAFADVVLGGIDRATRRVDVESFIVRHDRLGRALGRALVAAVARGVRCRLLYDPLGCRLTKSSFFGELRRAGVEVRAYGWVGALLFGRPAARNHARVIVVDDRAFTGGHAWGDEWLPKARGGHGWHDVCCGVSGAIVEDFAGLFEQHWRQALDEAPLTDFLGEIRDGLRLVCDAPIHKSVVLAGYLNAIDRARRRIWIGNSYFYPTTGFFQALVAACRRGVEVRVMVPGITDVPIIQWAARAAYGRWMREGIEIWEYRDVVMHSKYAIFDDDCCVIGTFNANAASVVAAIEVVLVSRVKAQVVQAELQFRKDLSASRRVDEESLRRRSLLRRVLDRLASLPMLLANAILQRRRHSWLG
jgi:cardiolipin synthase A/B